MQGQWTLVDGGRAALKFAELYSKRLTLERSFYKVQVMGNDKDYLGRLQDYYAENGVLPPYSIIMTLMGYRSKAPVAALVARLKLLGYLESTPEKRLKPGRLFFERTVFDSVQAGEPMSADDSNFQSLTVDQYLINQPSNTVLITVKGESMIEAGIMPGDTVIVEKRNIAQVGEMVVAIVDGEFTLKTLGKEKGGYVLYPANPDFSTIRPEGSLEIFGVVVGQFRKYK